MAPRALLLLGTALLHLECTARNPDYFPWLDSDGSLSDTDLRPICVRTERICLKGEGVSYTCGGGTFRPDRICPMNSACSGGYCRSPREEGPFQGKRCSSDNDCGQTVLGNEGYSCQPFVVDASQATLVLTCAANVGERGAPRECERGTDCRSGICIPSTGTCFRACSTDQTCPWVDNLHRSPCRPVLVTVEGFQVPIKSCVWP